MASLGGVTLLRFPQPYDFALSTERLRAFGADLANLWHEGGLHRVVRGREVRIESAPGGVEVEPLDEETEPVVRKLLGLSFDVDAFKGFAAGHQHLADLPQRLRGLAPLLVPAPSEMRVGSVVPR